MSPPPPNAVRLILSGAAVLLAAFVLPTAPAAAEPGAGGPLFAVIPTLGIGGPLAILALLFPSLFGGVLLLFRQWGAFFTVFSVQSLLVLLHGLCAPFLIQTGSWWVSESALWLMLTGVGLLGVLWALRRTVKSFEPDRPRLEAPPRTELLVLIILSVSCVLLAVWFRLDPPVGRLPSYWGLFFVVSVGIWAGALYRTTCYLFERAPDLEQALLPPEPVAVAASSPAGDLQEHVQSSSPGLPGASAYRLDGGPDRPTVSLPRRLRLPTEGVMLWAMLAALVVFLSQTGGADTSEVAESSEGQPPARFVEILPRNPDWRPGTNMVLATPWVEGDRLFVAAACTQPGATAGAVYCLDQRSGKTVWTFDDGGQMKQIFSSPRLADGRLYIGEGFHDDTNCKLYCLDAATGRKLWDFATESQTESSPCVAGGKVFFGAGNEGIYALDSRTGKKLWRYGQEPDRAPIFRVGASPTVAGQHLYVGSGMDRNHPDQCETALVCLKVATGKEVWKVKTDLPCWAEPVVAGPDVFFALGNGDVMTDAPQPAGRILCLVAATGKEAWHFDVPNGVLAAVAVDGRRVYISSRDGYCYCLGRFDGKQRWKRAMSEQGLGKPLDPVVAGPVLDQGALTGRAINVFVVSTAGRVCCLDAGTGAVHWTTQKKHGDLEPFGTYVSSTPRLQITPTPRGIRRRLFFGASINNLAYPAVYRVEDLLPADREEP